MPESTPPTSPAPQADPSRLGWSTFRRLPRTVWLVTALFGFALVLFSQLVPLFYAQDELEHADLAWGVRDQTGWLTREESVFDQRWLEARRAYQSDGRTADNAVPRPERPSLDDLAPPGPDPGGKINNAWQHPPAYYTAVAVILTAVGPFTPEWSYDVSLAVIRTLSTLMVLPVPVLLASTCLMLSGSRRAAVVAALVPLGLPTLQHIGAAANNDNLLLLATAVLGLVVASVMSGDTSIRTAVVGAFAGAVMVLTKATGLVALGWLPLAYAYAAWRGRRQAGGLCPALLAIAPPLVLGMVWYGRNLVVHGTPQPTRVWPEPPVTFAPDLFRWVEQALDRYTASYWANFVGETLPAWPGRVLAVVGAVVVAVALARGSRDRLRMLVMLAPLVGLAVILLFGTWSVYAETGQLRGFQGRYFFPALAGVAPLIGIGVSTLRTRWTPVASAALVVAIQATALVFLLNAYWGAEGASVSDRVAAVVAWSPWPGWVVGAAGLGWWAAAVALLAVLVRSASSPPANPQMSEPIRPPRR